MDKLIRETIIEVPEKDIIFRSNNQFSFATSEPYRKRDFLCKKAIIQTVFELKNKKITFDDIICKYSANKSNGLSWTHYFYKNMKCISASNFCLKERILSDAERNIYRFGFKTK